CLRSAAIPCPCDVALLRRSAAHPVGTLSALKQSRATESLAPKSERKPKARYFELAFPYSYSSASTSEPRTADSAGPIAAKNEAPKIVGIINPVNATGKM